MKQSAKANPFLCHWCGKDESYYNPMDHLLPHLCDNCSAKLGPSHWDAMGALQFFAKQWVYEGDSAILPNVTRLMKQLRYLEPSLSRYLIRKFLEETSNAKEEI